MAALLWIGLRRGGSLVVASDPPSSGKTTTLSALLPFFPDNAMLYFTRGLGERFELPPLADAPVYLMVNEISDHLPVYSWGAQVQRIFELMAEGYRLASTMHCDTTTEVIEQLRDDIGVDPSLIGHLTFVLPIEVSWVGGTVRRRSLELSLLKPTNQGPESIHLCGWAEEAAGYVPPTDDALGHFAERFGGESSSLRDDMTRRATLLAELVERRAPAEEVEEIIEAYETPPA